MQKTFFMILVVLINLMCLPVQGAALDGVNFPDNVQVGGKGLLLNGLGTRKATMFKVKVYVMGLYLSEKRASAKAIMQSGEPKRIIIQLVRDAEAKKIRDGWQSGFEKNAPDTAALQMRIDQFNAAMGNMKAGDKIVLDFVGEQVNVYINEEQKTSIEGADFQQGLLSIWLGPKPPNKDLKQGILGK